MTLLNAIKEIILFSVGLAVAAGFLTLTVVGLITVVILLLRQRYVFMNKNMLTKYKRMFNLSLITTPYILL